eukprot:862125-Rhodomonas_salina.1
MSLLSRFRRHAHLYALSAPPDQELCPVLRSDHPGVSPGEIAAGTLWSTGTVAPTPRASTPTP